MIITSKVQSIIYENPDEEDKQSSLHKTKNRNRVRTKSSQLNTLKKSDIAIKSIQNETKCIFIDNVSSINTENENKNNNDDFKNTFLRRNSCEEIVPKRCTFNKNKIINEERDLINFSLDSDSNTIQKTMIKRKDSDNNSNNELKPDDIELDLDDYIVKHNRIKAPFDYNLIIKYNEVWDYFFIISLDKELKSIKVEDFSKLNCLTRLLSKCFKQYALLPNLVKEKERIFCLTQIAYEESIFVHKRLLESIYQYLIQDNNPEYYNWSYIGFQTEPKNDLKEVGIFGLIQMIAFIDRYPSLSLGFYNFLTSIQCQWMFSLLLLNITKIVLELLYGGVLIPFCNKRKKILETLNSFYNGVIFHISKEIVSQNRHLILDKSTITIQYMSHLINEINEFAKKNPAHFFWNNQKLNDMYPLVIINNTNYNTLIEKESEKNNSLK